MNPFSTFFTKKKENKLRQEQTEIEKKKQLQIAYSEVDLANSRSMSLTMDSWHL